MAARAATDFEFRRRFALNTGLLLLAFGLYAVDRVNAGAALLAALGLSGSGASLRGLYAFGALVASAGAALRMWSAPYLSGAVVHAERMYADRLIADGPFRHVRNPLYLGSALVKFGQALLVSRAGALLLLVAVPWLQSRIIAREEIELSASLGASYQEYRARVPRYLPSLAPRLPASERRPSWKGGVLSALPACLSAFAIWIYVLSLDWRAFGLVQLLALGVARPLALRERRRLASDGAASEAADGS
jgi:protein-S-isoprenylcysteine O-methyltransferase Ste14